ncbi:MAG: L-seryl-tRNA(Sec) selenium transferase [Gemmatales bacterium]
MPTALRDFPAIHEVLSSNDFASLLAEYPRELLVNSLREQMNLLRQAALQGQDVMAGLQPEVLANMVRASILEALKPRLRTVINATGILLHTNLGRAPMAEVAAEAAASAARGYLNLELDLQSGKRSHRPEAVRGWLTRLLGCESATIVNNNAAATVLILRALALGRDVIVSRGELVEIGGSFRIPEIMAASGARLVEVGSTNITRLSDYARAITSQTALLLRVHASNYRIVGHTEAPSLEELVQLGQEHQLPVIDDIGSGALFDMKAWGLTDEPLASHSLLAGASLVLFSGDKLLGGPQCGIIAGKQELISRIERDPLMRAFRVDKMTLAALEATLRLYLKPDEALQTIPHFRMLETPLASLQERAYLLARYLGSEPGFSVHVQPSVAYVGGGSLPNRAVESVALALQSENLSDESLAHMLRMHEPAIMGRIENGVVLLDLRSVPAELDQTLAEAVRAVMHAT